MKKMKNTKVREGKGASQADFQACLPSRSHLTLTPNHFCSPARPNDPRLRHHLLTRCNNRGGQSSPSLWAKTKLTSSDIADPTSPKVTCAGQIKVRPKNKSSKNWQSVMEEIEKLHSNKNLRTPIAVETKCLKKDLKHFSTSLRGCFGSTKNSSSRKDEETKVGREDSDVSGSSKAVFSKWYMVLQENKKREMVNKEELQKEESKERDGIISIVPPSNALLLMRCRSAPANSVLEEEKENQQQDEKTESLFLKCYAPDLLQENSNEKWIVGGMKDPLSRSQHWKRC